MQTTESVFNNDGLRIGYIIRENGASWFVQSKRVPIGARVNYGYSWGHVDSRLS